MVRPDPRYGVARCSDCSSEKMAHEVDMHGLSLRMIEECGRLAEELGRNEPRPAEVCIRLGSNHSCGVPTTQNYVHLRGTKVLDHLTSGIAAALGFHPSSLPERTF